MVIQVKMGEPLWKTVGSPQMVLELDDRATVAEALARLQNMYPDFGTVLEAGGTHLGVPFNYFVNRKWIKDRDLARHELKEGDKLYILAPIVGGNER
jgi:sulfur carrier protein ThiS